MVEKPKKKTASTKTPTKSVSIGVRLDEKLRDYLQARADREDRSMSNLVVHLLTKIAEQDRWR